MSLLGAGSLGGGGGSGMGSLLHVHAYGKIKGRIDEHVNRFRSCVSSPASPSVPSSPAGAVGLLLT